MRKPINGYKGFFIDTNGDAWCSNPKNFGDKNPQIRKIKPIKYTCGYYYVNLGSNKKAFRIHRLVALTFLPNPEGKPHVAHKDGNRANNKIDNLYWATPKENEADKKRHGTAVFNILKWNKRKYDPMENRRVID